MRVLTLFILLTTPAYASGWDSFDDADVQKMLLFHLINLVILFGTLTYLLRGKIRDALANRAGQIKRDIDDSNKARKDAKHRYEDLEARLSGFEGELEKMREEALIDADKEREVILAQAEQDASRVKAAAERTIRDETERARTSLRQEAAKLSVDLARERLVAEVNADDQQRLTKDFLDTVQAESVPNG
jgi:F-type H+-transporting ATPase subunit b